MGINLSVWDKSFLADRKGGAATRERAAQTWRQLSTFCEKQKWKGVEPATITPKQMRLFLEHRAEQKIGARSIQNEASHLRRSIAGSGRDLGDIRKAENNWSNARMGVESASRFGGKAPMDLAVFEKARELLEPGVRACADLQLSLGLRRQESILSGRDLGPWAKELDLARTEGRGAFIGVSAGTKGGRERCTWVPAERVEAVLAVVQAGQAVQKNGCLVQADGLLEARTQYSNALGRAGLVGENSGHGLRRAFACAQLAHYTNSGFDQRDALARVSRDLGHGDGRGRWVWNNYIAGSLTGEEEA